MKKCDKCRKEALVIQNDEELCIKHYNLLPDEEEKPEPKKEVSINDYFIL